MTTTACSLLSLLIISILPISVIEDYVEIVSPKVKVRTCSRIITPNLVEMNDPLMGDKEDAVDAEATASLSHASMNNLSDVHSWSNAFAEVFTSVGTNLDMQEESQPWQQAYTAYFGYWLPEGTASNSAGTSVSECKLSLKPIAAGNNAVKKITQHPRFEGSYFWSSQQATQESGDLISILSYCIIASKDSKFVNGQFKVTYSGSFFRDNVEVDIPNNNPRFLMPLECTRKVTGGTNSVVLGDSTITVTSTPGAASILHHTAIGKLTTSISNWVAGGGGGPGGIE